MQIKPKTLAGFMELAPQKQIVFNAMLSIVRDVFEKNGLCPMDTPILHYSDVLLAKAGGDTEKQIYRFNKAETDMCMRFDLTVPLANYCALYENEIAFPFRRYEIGKVYRGERAQKGRFREFYQCDMDILNTEEMSLMCDAEIISILSQALDILRLQAVIKISNRKVLTGFLQHLNLEDKSAEIFNLLDKIKKLGHEKALEELTKITDSASLILKFVSINDIAELEVLPISNEVYKQGISELKELLENLAIIRTNIKIEIDLTIIRGLDYYTGTVFEAFFAIGEDKQISIGGGGRYDNLAQNYTQTKICGVGATLGLTRIFDILDKNNIMQFGPQTMSKVAIIPLGETLQESFYISKLLRSKHISNEVFYINKPFKNKLKLANRKKVPYIMVIGEEEVSEQLFGIKNMETGEVFEGSLDEIIEFLGVQS